MRLYLTVDHRTYSDPHDIAAEHERLVATALEGDIDGFRQELARHFQSALHDKMQDQGNARPAVHEVTPPA